MEYYYREQYSLSEGGWQAFFAILAAKVFTMEDKAMKLICLSPDRREALVWFFAGLALAGGFLLSRADPAPAIDHSRVAAVTPE